MNEILDPATIAQAVDDPQNTAVADNFCKTCPNWVEFQFESRIPENMPDYMRIAGLTARDVQADEAGMSFVVTDVEKERVEYRGIIGPGGFARVELPGGIEDVQFALQSERPNETLGVPEGEERGEGDSEEWWLEGLGRGALSGAEKGINNVMRSVDEFGFWVGWNPGWVNVNGDMVWMSTEERLAHIKRYGYQDFIDLGVDPPKGTVGQVMEGVTQFLIAFIPAVRVVRLVKAASVLGSTGEFIIAGVIADTTAFDPHERRLSNLIQEFPQLRNPVTEYLASAPGDSSAEGRLKNALEGIIFGAVLDGFVRALRVMKYGMSRMVITVKAQYRYRFKSESLEAVVKVLLEAARAVEPPITATLQSIAGKFGGYMEGLQFRFKSEESLARKISGQAVEEGKLYSEVAGQMKDVLRYTIIFPDNAYAAGVRDAAQELVSKGNRQIKFKNTWAGPGYRGINAVYETPQGFKFEVQFHTKASHHTKEVETHKLYEQQRLLPRTSEAWEALDEQQKALFDQVPVPSGALGLE
ncbi:hypothetical protein [Thalassospira marina]|uniref:RelA/SpoT domain-containing protein n=1 Tax=Thalassospira marina TaxID=2048283 RepID=A0ABN5FPH6_9PROT|nr:hypothetical protein [Thalassospira marina]AUG53500.1 hypothetical protein CSC3H3_12825 [Thalassospira marina]